MSESSKEINDRKLSRFKYRLHTYIYLQNVEIA